MINIGILGAGQLGRMLALAGIPLGRRFRFLDVTAEAPAGQVAELQVGTFTDTDTLKHFAEGLDVVTYEFENVPVTAADYLASMVRVYPPPAALQTAQDRLSEKTLFRRLGIPTPEFAPISTRDELDEAIARLGFPAVLKTRRLGYDGKGQMVLREPRDLDIAWAVLGQTALILEQFVSFERELSILAVCSTRRETAFYPLVENHHREGILRLSLAPAPDLTSALQQQAEAIAQAVLDELDYVGVLAIELFQRAGQLLANEMAPRVHNSGHWTIEGATTSQFENHLRAILGWPLGATTPLGYSAMVNGIGELPDPTQVLAVPDAHLHLYGKEPRPGRKVAHITLRAPDADLLQARLKKLNTE